MLQGLDPGYFLSYLVLIRFLLYTRVRLPSSIRFLNLHHRLVPRFTALSKFYINRLLVNPRPIHGELIL
jgi:hypothetical protein